MNILSNTNFADNGEITPKNNESCKHIGKGVLKNKFFWKLSSIIVNFGWLDPDQHSKAEFNADPDPQSFQMGTSLSKRYIEKKKFAQNGLELIITIKSDLTT
jgi:hypothetical protein